METWIIKYHVPGIQRFSPLFTDWFWVLEAPTHRFEVKNGRFDLESNRFEVRINRFEAKSDRFDLKTDRFDLKADRLNGDHLEYLNKFRCETMLSSLLEMGSD